MRIAQIAPLFEPVPPPRYGGTERVVHWLTEALVAQGHDVTLFAAGNSTTSARLVATRERAQRFVPNFEENGAPYMRLLELVLREAHEFDVLHFHIDFWPLSLFSRQATPFLSTLHGRLDRDWVRGIYDLFPTAPLVSISDAQRAPVPHLGWAGTIHHGMPANLLTPQPAKQDYLAFLGRISPEKGIEHAIRIARATRAQVEGRREDRRGGCGVPRECHRAAARRRCGRVRRRNRRRAEAGVPLRRRGRCCSRSTGRSRSASS